MSRNWAKALAAAFAMAVALLAAPAAHAGNGYFTSQDLTASIGAPVGEHQPAGWSTPWDLQRHVAYVDYQGSDLIVASSAPGGAWSWTRAANRVPAGFLSVYSYSWDHSSHIVYTDGTNYHLMEVWSSENSPTWQTIDLTTTYGGPLASWHPHGYEQDGQQHIVFERVDTNAGELWEAVFRPGIGWRFANVSTQSGIHMGAHGEWALTATSLGAEGEAIGYLGADGYPHMLTGLRGRWLDQRVGTPAHDTYYNLNSMVFLRDGHTQRYVLRYLGIDDDVHEAAWTAAGWTDTNVTAVTGSRGIATPHLANDAYIWNADGSEHMFATDRNTLAVHEFVRTRDGRWYFWTDTGPVHNDLGWAAGFAAPDDAVHGTETEFYIYYDDNQHVIISDLTAPYQA
ncbi:hypothetical protein [Kutzneria sp. 744]|uniref:hypothetical protein n=1 Tax=Kutzneria sp. (strain 744) TaxID=345341 RepID=UPI0003EEA552|nr:hypothetical protein [Kutzneria sp. 744]EWM11472.1 mucin-5B [Kutzneria sp. 744]